MCNDRPMNGSPSIQDQLMETMAKMTRPAPRPNHVVLVEVSRELAELEEKIHRLGGFLLSDPELSETQKKLLVCQLKYMKEYAKTLSLRIEDLSIAIREDIDKSSDSE